MSRLARLVGCFGCLLGVALALLPATAAADWGIEAEKFGIEAFDGQFADRNGGIFTQAGGHPHEFTVQIVLKSHPDNTPGYVGQPTPNGQPRNIEVELPEGFLGNATGAVRCTAAELQRPNVACPTDSVVGATDVHFNGAGPESLGNPIRVPVFNMVPPVGVAARFGFSVLQVPVVLDARLTDEGRIIVGPREIPQALRMWRTDTTIWGVPADPSHDSERCEVYVREAETGKFECSAPRKAGVAPVAFLSMPTSCTPMGEGIETTLRTDSWFYPSVFHTARFKSHQPPNYPEPLGPEIGTTGCETVPFAPKLDLQPTSLSAESPTGLQVQLDMPTDGLINAEGVSQSHLKATKVTMPEGLTINPSQAEGLGVCTLSDLDRETPDSAPGQGCPSSSKLGTVSVETPLLDHAVPGDIYLARPDDPGAQGQENLLDALIAIYIVLKDPVAGIDIALPGRVQGDPRTGRISATFDDLPQVAFSSFKLRFREGARSPLINPARCGDHTTEIEFTSWSDPGRSVHRKDSFQVKTGVAGGPCPSGGLAPFNPTFQAGTVNNGAGSFSPVVMRLTRNDGEQEMTKFSSVLPKGVTGRLAGITNCPDAAIALATTKSGREEQASSSCPASSLIGTTQVGAGAGAALTYVPGKIYLAGPFKGAPLSVAVITPAVAGPFDIGTVVVREALEVDPRTAEVRVDGNRSDPIPHILEGIPLKLRDLRILVDRPNFILNPTSCEPSATNALLWGSHFDLLSSLDDVPVSLSSRFQAADCAALGFKPRLELKLSGGTKRGTFPALKATLRPRSGDANLDKAVVTLPRSTFLEQGHIGTICTRVQFAAEACPPRSAYGSAQVFTPLLDEPLQGPVYLRSSANKLPDLVMDLHGRIDIEVSGRIDSIKGRIRSTFEGLPDAPVSKFVLTMKGGQKGLIVNSRNLCTGISRADIRLTGQNGKSFNTKPKVSPGCVSKRSKRGKR